MTDPTPISTDPYHIAYALRAGDPNRTDPQLLRDAEAVILELAKYRDEWKLKFQSLVEDKYKAMRERDSARREREHWKSNHDNATRKVTKMGEMQAEIAALRLFVDGQKFHGNYHPPTQEAITALREAVRVMAIDLKEFATELDLREPLRDRAASWIGDDVLANEIAAAAIKEADK